MAQPRAITNVVRDAVRGPAASVDAPRLTLHASISDPCSCPRFESNSDPCCWCTLYDIRKDVPVIDVEAKMPLHSLLNKVQEGWWEGGPLDDGREHSLPLNLRGRATMRSSFELAWDGTQG
eukprot:4667607-Pyramimonas_sp.AAC.1